MMEYKIITEEFKKEILPRKGAKEEII